MREPPAEVSDAEVLTAVRAAWLPGAESVAHLPLGFGAFHWRVSSGGSPQLFATLDRLGAHHTGTSLEDAYRGAAALAATGLEFVVPPLPVLRPQRHGASYTVTLGDGRLSCTPWLDGTVAGDGPLTSGTLALTNAADLARLHAAVPPARLPRWQPRVGEDFADLLDEQLDDPWDRGPLGRAARTAIEERLPAIRRWTSRYYQLIGQAHGRRWVPTHGEPHTTNQLLTADGAVFVDWESLALAPRERDLRPLVDAGHADLVAPDWAMIEMYDLEWRLDEVSQYATWFVRDHSADADDQIAYEGLLSELARPDFTRP